MSYRFPRDSIVPAYPPPPIQIPGNSFGSVESAQEYFEAKYEGIRVQSGAAVVIRSDDSGLREYDTIMPLLDERGLCGSFAENIDIVSAYDTNTVTEMAVLASHGHEIINHSAVHDNPFPGAEATERIVRFQQAMVDNDIFCDSFIQPGSWTNDRAGIDSVAAAEEQWYRELMQANFAASGAYVPDPSLLGVTRGFNAFRRYGGLYQENLDNDTVATIKADIDEVIARNGFFHILLHGYFIDEPGQLTAAQYEDILDHIVLRRDAGELDVLSFTGSIYATRGPYINLINDGSFELSGAAGHFVGWETFTGTPTILGTADAYSGTYVGVTDSSNVLRYRMPVGNFPRGELRIRARAAAANATARVDVWGTTGGSPSYTRDTAVTNAGWTEIRINVGPQGPGLGSFRIFLSSTDANDVWWDDAWLIKR